MLKLSEELMRQGHEVMFFGMHNANNNYAQLSSCIPEVDFTRANGLFHFTKNICRALQNHIFTNSVRQLNRVIGQFQPDIIHAHNIYNQISPSIFKETVKHIPVIMTVHDFKPICPSYNCFVNGSTCTRCISRNYMHCIKNNCVQNSKLKSILAALSSWYHSFSRTYDKCYTHFIAPSNFMKTLLCEGGFASSRISVINNFAETSMPSQNIGKHILYYGRICNEKGIDTLLRAYALLPESRPELRIAGSGPQEYKFKTLAFELGIKVSWLGRLSHEDIVAEISDARCTVTPSLWFENCSISILESIAYGRMCIASDSGGNPELIKDSVNGFVFRAGDYRSLADKLQLMCELDAASIGKMNDACTELAQNKYSIDSHLEKIMEIYNKIIQKHKAETE